MTRARLAAVIDGYTYQTPEGRSTVAGTGGDFAYLRTGRIPPESVGLDLQHEQVWLENSELYEAAPLPPAVTSDQPLPPSRFNVYGVVPPGLNRWEREFAKVLDADQTGTVEWWHRNEDRKPHSIALVLPSGMHFFPDFAVGVRHRSRAAGVLLVEVKGEINRPDSIDKNTVEHKTYRRPMMLHWENEERWKIVRYDEASFRNLLDGAFRFDMLASF